MPHSHAATHESVSMLGKAVWRQEDDPPVDWTPGGEARGRRIARAIALQALYEADVIGHPAGPAAERLAKNAGLRRRDAGFAVRLARSVEERRGKLDARIAGLAPAWPIDQIAAVDRNILRLAIVELEYIGETPGKVVVDEAVELAKLFGSEASQKFVNGVLGTVLG